MKRKIAFLFPGQGSQYPGMGKDFFDTFAAAKHVFEEANELLSYKVSDIIFNSSDIELKKTKNSQLAIFITSMAILKTLKEQSPELVFHICAGHSLGEYTALCAADILDFPTALRLIYDRAHFMNNSCEKRPGSMCAVMGLTKEEIKKHMAPISEKHLVWIANYNCPGQTIISGTKKGVEYAASYLKEKGAKRVIPLAVHGAFHTPLMQEAQENLKPKLSKANFQKSDVKVVMNVTGNIARDTEAIRENLIQQMTHCVLWEHSILTMMKENVTHYVEIGCKKTLTPMNKKIGVEQECSNVDKVFDLDLFINRLDSLTCSI